MLGNIATNPATSRLWAATIVAAGTTVSIFLTANIQLLPFVLGASIAGAMLFYCLRYPAVLLGVFWLMYALQTTVFEGTLVQGLYYPVYALLVVHALRAFFGIPPVAQLRWKPIVSYTVFYATITFGALRQSPNLAVDATQILLIYALGFLSALQLNSDAGRRIVLFFMSATAIAVAMWVVISALSSPVAIQAVLTQSGAFPYRGGIAVNQNFTAAIVAVGLIPLALQLTVELSHRRWPSTIVLTGSAGICLYAVLLLASRGAAAALLACISIYAARCGRSPRQLVLNFSVAAALALLVGSLPGIQGLFSRAAEYDAASFGSRLPLWRAALDSLGSLDLLRLIVGSGMGSSDLVATRANPLLGDIHSSHLTFLIDFGILGYGLFLWLHWQSAASAIRERGFAAETSLLFIVFLLVFSASTTLSDNFTYWIIFGFTFPVLKTFRS